MNKLSFRFVFGTKAQTTIFYRQQCHNVLPFGGCSLSSLLLYIRNVAWFAAIWLPDWWTKWVRSMRSPTANDSPNADFQWNFRIFLFHFFLNSIRKLIKSNFFFRWISNWKISWKKLLEFDSNWIAIVVKNWIDPGEFKASQLNVAHSKRHSCRTFLHNSVDICWSETTNNKQKKKRQNSHSSHAKCVQCKETAAAKLTEEEAVAAAAAPSTCHSETHTAPVVICRFSFGTHCVQSCK